MRRESVSSSEPDSSLPRWNIRREKRRREGRSMKLSATAREAVADAQVEMSQEEGTEASSGTS